ncbi:hypothetical protein [Nocardia cyriacigeorgica]|uniref:hypothetical protein n=1 Tax=Nocardia cyriacigeorgica TaxID=135487 RepID=UPI001895486B|nr:hypothetical protein [Nocardia cyriacigeorgica]MBF6325871.1 hypothetical protein [Nocardia cyriacigeorgica]
MTQPTDALALAKTTSAAHDPHHELRSDFTQWVQLILIAPFGEDEAQMQRFRADAAALAQQWGHNGTPDQQLLWAQLSDAARGWIEDPDTTYAEYDRLTAAKSADVDGDDTKLRNLRQAGEVTGRIDAHIAGSGQDGARWRPPRPERGPTRQRTSLLDRALGGRGPDISLAEVDEILIKTDQLLAAEEALGDFDGNSPAPARPGQRFAPSTSGRGGDIGRAVETIRMLRELQNLTAEHARESENWPANRDHDQHHIARLDSLLSAARTLRADAAAAGIPISDLEAVYHAGRDGTSWDERPGVTSRPMPTQNGRDGSAISDAVTAAIPDLETGEWPAHASDIDTPTPSNPETGPALDA